MSNDIECFINMIFLTEYMNDLLYNDKDGIEKNKDIIYIVTFVLQMLLYNKVTYGFITYIVGMVHLIDISV